MEKYVEGSVWYYSNENCNNITKQRIHELGAMSERPVLIIRKQESYDKYGNVLVIPGTTVEDVPTIDFDMTTSDAYRHTCDNTYKFKPHDIRTVNTKFLKRYEGMLTHDEMSLIREAIRYMNGDSNTVPQYISDYEKKMTNIQTNVTQCKVVQNENKILLNNIKPANNVDNTTPLINNVVKLPENVKTPRILTEADKKAYVKIISTDEKLEILLMTYDECQLRYFKNATSPLQHVSMLKKLAHKNLLEMISSTNNVDFSNIETEAKSLAIYFKLSDNCKNAIHKATGKVASIQTIITAEYDKKLGYTTVARIKSLVDYAFSNVKNNISIDPIKQYLSDKNYIYIPDKLLNILYDADANKLAEAYNGNFGIDTIRNKLATRYHRININNTTNNNNCSVRN